VELKHIKELMASMGRTGTKKLQIKQNDFELTLERHDLSRPMDINMDLYEDFKQPLSQNRADQALSHGSNLSSAPVSSLIEAPKQDDKSLYVTSPMVGTFYGSPSPDDPVFIKPGDKIEKNTIVCIIEAMKVMNEVKANVSGTVAEVLVESGQPVEFGSKLFRIIE
jgi:acetyl-CoA carboxylase biotin carboxyl carrier protein